MVNADLLENAPTAFLLAIAAGMCTNLGASIVFCPALVKMANRGVLAAGLSFSAGVMLLIGFIDIWAKSFDAFVNYGSSEAWAFTNATISLGIGAVFLRILDVVVSMMNGGVPTLEAGLSAEEWENQNDEATKKQLNMIGLTAALAIAGHNFPEGIAVFVASLEDPTVGASLAIGIAFHNIPEGLAVAMPIYYATGNRVKAFCFAFVSGVAEIIGAGIAYTVIYMSGDDINQLIYAVMFGVVAGIMVMLSTSSLLPTAARFDPTDRLTSNFIIIGMAFMATSLCLFQF